MLQQSESLQTDIVFDFETTVAKPAAQNDAPQVAPGKRKGKKRKHFDAPTQYDILAVIAEHGPRITNASIARLMKCPAPLVTRRTSSLFCVHGFVSVDEIKVAGQSRAAYTITDAGRAKLAALTASAPRPVVTATAMAAPVCPAPAPAKPRAMVVVRYFFENPTTGKDEEISAELAAVLAGAK